MTELRVTFSEIEAARGNIQTGVNKVNGSLDDLKTYLQPLVATWSGEAQATYQALQQQWDTSAAELNQVLNSIQIAVGQANEAYQQAERTNTSRFA